VGFTPRQPYAINTTKLRGGPIQLTLCFLYNTRMHRSAVSVILDCLAIGIITITSIFLWNNKNYFAVPDPDIFQYISDGQRYIQFKPPDNVQTPPANAILIASLTKLLHAREHPEILSAHIINIAAAILTMCLLYFFVRSYSRAIGVLVLTLISTNPLYAFQSLNVTSEVLFAAAVAFSLLLYKKNKTSAACFVAGLSFMIRYEGLLLLVSIVALNLLRRVAVKKTITLGFLLLIPIIVWFFIANRFNGAGNITGNNYIQEVVYFNKRIPQFSLVTRIPNNLIDYIIYETADVFVLTGIVLTFAAILSGAVALVKRGDATLRLVLLFTLLYLTFHIFFPFAPDRYLYPVLWILYLTPLLGGYFVMRTQAGKGGATKLVGVTCVVIIILLAAGNLQKTIRYYYNNETVGFAFPRNYRVENKLAADWLNQSKFDKPIMVFTYEPWVMRYFTNNHNILFFEAPYTAYQRCDSIECLIKTNPSYARDHTIFYIQQSSSASVDSSFPSAANFNVHIFNQFPNADEKNNFILLTKLTKLTSWAKIYEYQPPTADISN
jgi:hypothetical protein